MERFKLEMTFLVIIDYYFVIFFLKKKLVFAL